MAGTIESRLADLGLEVPPVKTWPSPNRTGCVEVGQLLFVSGHGPGPMGDAPNLGKVPADVSEEDAQVVARQCALMMMASIKDHLGDLDRVKRVVKLLGFVASSPGFDRQFAVIDGASNLFLELWGPEFGCHARAAIGTNELPRANSVEIEGIFELHP